MAVGDNIRHYRKQLALTQAQLADRLGVTVQAVSKWETGAGLPDTAQIVPLAQALNISTDTLLCNRDRERKYQHLWEHALRYEHTPERLLAVCLEILEDNPNHTDFLYRAAVNEKWLAEISENASEQYAHWSMSRQYTDRLLRLMPNHESGKQHLVEVLSALGLEDEAVAQAYRCSDSSLALLSCLKGDALYRHRQKRINAKFRDLLNEIDALDLPDVTESLIQAAIPDGNEQHYAFYRISHRWDLAKELYDAGQEDALMKVLYDLFDLARKIDEAAAQSCFTAPLFNRLEGFRNPPGISSHTHQFIENALMLFPKLRKREDFKDLLANAMAYKTGTD